MLRLHVARVCRAAALCRMADRLGIVTIPDWRCSMHRGCIEGKGLLLNIHFGLAPLISLLAGILILMMPKLLNYIVAFYLIAIGLIGLLGLHQLRLG